MRKFKFGVDTFIWAEDFTEKDLWIVEKAAELGFEVIDFAVAHPDTFPVDQVKELLDKTGLIPVTTTTLGLETNPISPDPAIRAAALEHMKKMVDISKKLGATILLLSSACPWAPTSSLAARLRWASPSPSSSPTPLARRSSRLRSARPAPSLAASSALPA